MKRKTAKKPPARSKQVLTGDEMIIIFGGFLIILFIILSLSGSQTNKPEMSAYPTPTQSEIPTYDY